MIFDSGASPEYDECALKLRFMSEDTPGFDLIETLAYHSGDGYLLLERHMQRLQASSAYFGFPFREEDVREELLQHVRIFAGSRRVRLLLSADGGISVTSTDLPPAGQEAVFNLVIAQETTWSTDRFLFHKTTNRAFYDDTRQRYQAETGCQEVLFLNENGYLTEGSYTTLFVKRNGSLQTPALRHGLLPGTFRAGLLERGLASEADLTLQDLQEAEEVYVGNSVRGLIRARLLSEQASGSWHMEAGQHNEATRKAG